MIGCPVTLAISGYYGFDNAGDEAVLAGMVEALRTKEDGVRIIVLSANPRRTSAEHGVEAVPRMSLPAILGALRESDLLVSGGGSLLQDATSSRTVPYYAGIVRLAGLCGVPGFLYAQGVGPLRGFVARSLTADLRHHVAGVSVRDSDSEALLVSLGYAPEDVQVTADPVFGLSGLPKSEVRPLLGREGIPTQGSAVAISLRRSGHDHEVLQETKALAVHLARRGIRVVLVPFHHPEDIRICDELVEECGSEGLHVLRHVYSPRQLMSLLGLFDVVIGMRLHSLIFAARMGVPCVGLSYDPKVASFCSLIGAKCLDVGRIPPGALVGAFDDVAARTKELVGSLQIAYPGLRDAALRTADAALALARQHHERKERSR